MGKDGWIEIGKIMCACAVLFVVIVWVLGAISGVQCRRAWADSGMQADYARVRGCRVRLDDGRWIPARAYIENRQAAP